MAGLQVRLLISPWEAPEIAWSTEVKRYLDERTCELKPGVALPRVTEAHLRIAQGRLERTTLIGIKENLELSLALWKAALYPDGLEHLQNIRDAPHVCGNKEYRKCSNSTLQHISKGTLELMAEDNKHSLALYDCAKSLFDMQLQAARNRSSGRRWGAPRGGQTAR